MKKILLFGTAIIFSSITLVSCGGPQLHSTGINSQTQRVNSNLKRTDYTILDQTYSFSVQNKKEYRRHTVDQLKEVAFMGAEKAAINAGADGVLNPVYVVEQKRRKFFITARVKAYKIKSDNEYLDMENSLKHRPSASR